MHDVVPAASFPRLSPSKSMSNMDELSLRLGKQQLTDCPSNVLPNPTSSRGFYGRFRSLYNNFDDSTVSQLEEAILLGHVRAFESALSIFELFPSSLRYNAVIATEHSLVLWNDMRYWDAAELLRAAILFAEENGQDACAHNVYRVMTLLLANAEIFTEGDLTGARESLIQTRLWLQNVAIEEMDDVHIYSMNRYYILVDGATSLSLGFNSEDFEIFPRAKEGSGESTLTNLRRYLQGQGRLYEAYMVLTTEISRFAEEDPRRSSIRSFLSFCSKSNIGSLWNIEGGARLLLARSLHNSENHDLSDEQLQLSQLLYSQAPVPERLNFLGIQTRLTKLRFTGGHSREKLARWLEFLEDDSVKQDYSTTQSALLEAADVAATILKSDKDLEIRRQFWNLQCRAESLLEERRNLCTLYIYRSSGDEVARIYGEDGAILKWHDDFHTKYPRFSLPRMLIAGYRKRMEVYQRLKDLDNLVCMVKQLDDCVRQGREFWRETSKNRDGLTATVDHQHLESVGSHVSGMSAIQNPNQPDVGRYWHSEWSDDLNLYYYENWHLAMNETKPQAPRDGSSPFVTKILGTNNIRASSVYVTLLRWLKQAFENKDLSRGDLESIFSPLEEVAGGEDVCTLLERITPELLFARFSEMSSASWERPFAILSDWLLNRSKHMETKRQYVLAFLQHQRTLSVHSPDSKTTESQRMLDLVPQLNETAAVSFKVCKPEYRNSLARAKKMILCRDMQNSGLYEETAGAFCEILDLFDQSLQEGVAAGDLRTQISTLSEIAQLYFIPASKGRPLSLQQFFNTSDAAEAVLQKLKEGWSVLSGHSRVEKMLLAVEEGHRNDLTAMGIHLLCLPSEHQNPQRDSYIWYLIQRMKSRGFGWLMQLNLLSTRHRAMEASQEMLLPGVIQLNRWDQLKPIASESGNDVLFVDWYSSLGRPELPTCPILVTSHNGDTPRVWFSDMDWKEAESVMDKFLRSDETDLAQQDSKRLLQRLQPLIQPLAQASQPGQTLVFCSIGKIHQIPLHALKLNGEELIRRNPIVYCSSLATLRATFEMRKLSELHTERSNPEVPQRPWKASLFGQPISKPGKKVFSSLAKKLNVEPYVKDAFTSWNFSSAIHSGTNLVHFHSHADYKEHDPLRQSLVFDDGDEITIDDVYDFSPSLSYHATLLACRSGMSKTSISNEVVGLVPAFLYSGAASTVSTLWKFADEDAALFTEYFYEAFDQKLQGAEGGRVDLAKALQGAVLKIMEKDDALYHWAPFVLNGYWMYEVGKTGV